MLSEASKQKGAIKGVHCLHCLIGKAGDIQGIEDDQLGDEQM